MALLLTAEGEIVIGIDEPLKAQRVVDGVENWLLKARACDLRWEGDCLHFRGVSIWSLSGNMSSLIGIGRSAIRFQRSADKVIMNFTIAFSHSQTWIIAMVLLAATAASGLPLWRCLLVLPIIVSLTYLISLTKRHEFRSNLQLAGIRGLADGATRELADLQTKSEREPVSK